MTKELVTKLGDGQVFVRQDDKGAVQCVRATVTLSKELGEVVEIQGKAVITVSGYNKLNQFASLNILTPTSCIVDGREQSNPYIERNPQTKVIQTIAIRKVAFGYSPIGNMTVVDKTLFFNIFTYFLQDLQAKIKKYPACGCLGLKDTKPTKIIYTLQEWKTTSDGKKYPVDGQKKEVSVMDKPMAFYSIEEPVGIWVDISHPEIQDAFNSHTQRQKFGDRHAQSIVERNCLKTHPAIASSTVIVDKATGTASVEVFGWQHKKTFQDLNEMAQEVSNGTSEVEIATYEEAQEVEAETIDEESPHPIEEPHTSQGDEKQLEAPQSPPDEDNDIDSKVAKGTFIIGDEKATTILKKTFKVDNVSQLSEPNKVNFLKLINTELDKRAGRG